MKDLAAILSAEQRARELHEETLLVTLIRTVGSTYRRAGARMLVLPGNRTIGTISGGCLESQVARDAWEQTRNGNPVVLEVENHPGDEAWEPNASGCHGKLFLLAERLPPSAAGDDILTLIRRVRTTHEPAAAIHHFRESPAGLTFLRREFRPILPGEQSRWLQKGDTAAFIEIITPPPHLLLFGAGNDAQPVARIAGEMGWAVTIVDSRARFAARDRFPAAEEISADGIDGLRKLLRPHSAIVLMSHRFSDDAAALAETLGRHLPYVGLLGPRRRTERLFAHLAAQGRDLSPADLAAIRSPVGLDLAGDSPETIALAIIAEIQAVLAGRAAGMLHDKAGPLRPAIPANEPV